MKRLIILVFGPVALLLLAFYTSTFGAEEHISEAGWEPSIYQPIDWEQVASPGDVEELAVIDGVVFARTADALFRSADCATSWYTLPISASLDTGQLYAMDVDSGTLYLGTDNGAITSDDLGDSFSWSFPWGWDPTRDVDFQDGYGWLVVSSWGSRSGPNRKTPTSEWELRRGDLPWSHMSLYWVVVDPLDPLNVAYVGHDGGPYSNWRYRTLDGGESWVSLRHRVILATTLDSEPIAIANNVFTKDWGETWQPLGISAGAMVKNTEPEFFVAADGTSGIYIGHPEQWHSYGLHDQTIRSLAICEEQVLAVSINGDIFRTLLRYHAVALTPNYTNSASSGSIVYTHVLTNSGNYTDTFDLDISLGWGELLTNTPITLAQNGTTTVQARVTIPTDAISGTVERTVITATSQAIPGVWASVTDTTTVSFAPSVALSPGYSQHAGPGSIITYTHILSNGGNYTDTFDLDISPGWGELLTNTPITLAQNGATTVQARVTIPTDAISGTVERTVITATSQANPDVYTHTTDTTIVTHSPGVALAPNLDGSAAPGTLITYTHILTNTGNGSDIFHLTHHSNQGWTVEYDTPVTLDHWQTAPITVNVAIPAGAISGTLDAMVITATSETDANVSASVIDTTRIETTHHLVYLPVVARAYWTIVGESESYIGQRSGSSCAEHDSYVVPVVTTIEGNTLSTGTEITGQYRIRATHPIVEVHPLGAPWYEWCDADWTDCPVTRQSVEFNSECQAPIQITDNIVLVWDECDSQEQIYVLDGASDIGTFEVIINDTSYGRHTGVIFGSRWNSAGSWNHDGVIYANGFTRWKPKGEEPGAETDPCFGTSVVLGPFQLDQPFLSDGYSPNPLRHPKIEEINITVCPDWQVQMTGAFVEGEQELMDISWSIERLNISSSEMLVLVSQHATAVTDVQLYQVLGQYGVGQVEMSSMFANPQKHDADTQMGPEHEIWVGDISNFSEGLWGQENSLHPLTEGHSLCLETETPTTHNTGSPTLCILWDSGEVH